MLLCGLVGSQRLYAQMPNRYTVRGCIVDSASHEPVSFATVKSPSSGRGVLADADGKYKIDLYYPSNTILVSAMGYSPKEIKLTMKDQVKNVELVSTGLQLSEVIVKPKKEKYSKKNNPAVDFVRKIRNSRNQTDPRQRHDDYNYDRYERITIALNNISPEDNKNLILKKFDFLKDCIDTSEVSGKPILAISSREKLSEFNYSASKGEKEHVKALRRVGVDDFLDEENMRVFYEDMFPEIDLYSNDIELLRNRFVSPLSRIAPDFYKFYLTDTLEVDGDTCIVLAFVPHNSQSFGFTGKVYVPKNDTTMFIKKVSMNVPVDINLNFIDRLYINQEYKKAPDGSRLLIKDDLIAEVDVLPGFQGLYFRRNSAYDNHNFDKLSNQEIFKTLGRKKVDADANAKDSLYWASNRLIAYTEKENKVGQLTQELRRNKLYYWTEKFLKTMFIGYIDVVGSKSKFMLGPVSNLISSNSLEGIRLRVGGLTTANLSKHWFLGGFVAYGFKDKKWKYSGEVEYSFREKEQQANEFPIHSIKARHTYNVDMLGQKFTVTNPDNLFLSIRRHPDRQITYRRETELKYTLELTNNFSVVASWNHSRQQSTEYMTFVNGYGERFDHINLSAFTVKLRYAPGEKFYQTKTERKAISKDAPVLTLSHTFAPKGFLGSSYEVNRTELSFQKRFWFSAFGSLDVLLKGAHIWSAVSYPDLLLPNANLSYIIQPESFALLNPMELVTDTYASWDLTYWGHGVIFNYIPLIKKLKLREAVTFRGVWGHLSNKNNPEYNPALFRFPEVSHSRPMTNTPYMEIGVGIDNILKFFRVDYVWRLTYRNNPGADLSGVRVAMHFAF
ncbi:MAG: DUF5686 and carboxypeptidase regulatory-like domain-containing protein [Paramuribaculum sp.]|nr:DUF5686 and carboxypeptidase regulatory-like domain-containing protein [Paramuribaculum sp.]